MLEQCWKGLFFTQQYFATNHLYWLKTNRLFSFGLRVPFGGSSLFFRQRPYEWTSKCFISSSMYLPWHDENGSICMPRDNPKIKNLLQPCFSAGIPTVWCEDNSCIFFLKKRDHWRIEVPAICTSNGKGNILRCELNAMGKVGCVWCVNLLNRRVMGMDRNYRYGRVKIVSQNVVKLVEVFFLLHKWGVWRLL